MLRFGRAKPAVPPAPATSMEQPDPYAPDPFAQPKPTTGLFGQQQPPPPQSPMGPGPFDASFGLSPHEVLSKPPPTSLEVFWGVISCSPVAPQTEETALNVPPPNYLAGERSKATNFEDKKRLNDLDLINQRLKEAALKRKKETKDTDQDALLGEDVAAARRKLMQEEAYKRDKQAEFQKTQNLQREAMAAAEKQKAETASIFDGVAVRCRRPPPSSLSISLRNHATLRPEPPRSLNSGTRSSLRFPPTP